MKIFLGIWGALAVASLLGYGFTGVGLWTPLVPEDGALRAMILFAFHMGGVIALTTLTEPEYRK